MVKDYSIASLDFETSCPIDMVLDLLSAKWTVQILRELSIGPVRTRRFLKFIPGLSMKCLQERLKALIATGMVARAEFDEKVPRVEYSITPRGRRLFAVMSELKQIAAEIGEVTCKCPMEEPSGCHIECHQRCENSRLVT
ncbi:MAG: helix-turn-helix transcriptional regulator [Cyanobacteria bacterium TGS_CYA1]|nr:helix-turn-helix transcriptional regulator [Cyanobacteria bacterium TGS_CYA1]